MRLLRRLFRTPSGVQLTVPGPRAAGRTAAVLAAALGLLALAPPAHAAPPAPYDYAHPGGAIPSGENGVASGLTYNDSGPQGSVFNASLGSMWIKDPASGSPLRTFCSLYGTAFGSAGPWTEESLTSQGAARVAWVISRFGGKSPAGDAAVQDMIHVFFTNTQDRVLKILNATPSGSATLAEAQRMWEASAPYTGSYRTSPAIQSGPSGTGAVVDTQVASASGNISIPIKLTLSGNAVFDSTGTDTYTGTSGDAPTFHVVNGGGSISVSQTTSPIGSSLRQFSSPGNQTQLAAAAPMAVSGSAKSVDIWGTFQPKAGSSAPKYVNVGGLLTDVLHVTTAGGGADWIPGVGARFDVEWFYYPSEQESGHSVPEGGASLGMASAVADAPGDLIVRGPRADRAGFYYPVARFAVANQPVDRRHHFVADWSAGFNDPGEQSVVKYAPRVVTKTGEISNGTIADAFTVSGSYPGQRLSVVSELILTSECAAGEGADTPPADAQIAGRVTTQVAGDGTVTTAPLAVPWAKVVDLWAAGKGACLSWHESIEATETTDAWQGKYLVPAETTVLEKPTLTTEASGNGTVPVESRDKGKVTGTIPSGPGVKTVTKVEQYKFGDSTDGSARAVCADPSYASDWQDVLPGASSVTYPTHTIERPGTYGYVETLKVIVDGKEAILHTGACGEQGETVIAFSPSPPAAPPSSGQPAAAPSPGRPAAPADVSGPLVNAGNVGSPAGSADAGLGGPMVPLGVAGAASVLVAAYLGVCAALRRRAESRESVR